MDELKQVLTPEKELPNDLVIDLTSAKFRKYSDKVYLCCVSDIVFLVNDRVYQLHQIYKNANKPQIVMSLHKYYLVDNFYSLDFESSALLTKIRLQNIDIKFKIAMSDIEREFDQKMKEIFSK